MPDILWAPWRLAYIESAKQEGDKPADIFLDLPARGDDRRNLILFRGKTAFIMLNAFPYSNAHLMVAPYRQTAELDGLDDAELLEINQLLAKAVRCIRAVYQPDGFNIGINMGRVAGAGIPVHIHWHIVPRWNGDTNFMTVVGETRVIPASLEDVYDRLLEAVRADV